MYQIYSGEGLRAAKTSTTEKKLTKNFRLNNIQSLCTVFIFPESQLERFFIELASAETKSTIVI